MRKPKLDYFLEASKNHNINIKESISIGDSKRDLIASKLAGIRKTYLISNNTDLVKEEYFEESFESLLECSKFLKNNSTNK